MHGSMVLCVASLYMYFLEYARETPITEMKKECFQKTEGFKRCSEDTLLASLSYFIGKKFIKQKAQETSNLVLRSNKKKICDL